MEKRIIPSNLEDECRRKMIDLFRTKPIPDDQILENLELYMRPQRISEIIVLYELYKKIVDVPGFIMEFGVRWGRHLSTFNALRSFLEPFNFYRRIIGFDTFEGFLEPSKQDGASERVFKGAMTVSKNYEDYLQELMRLHELETPLSHIPKIELHKGDAASELSRYLEATPEAIIALAYFDMDVYKPTKECLKLIKKHLVKGSIIAFDELIHPQFPGETVALIEEFDLYNCKLRKINGSPYPCYICIE